MYSDLLIYQTGRKIQKNYQSYFRTIGLPSLTFTQYIVLRELWNSPTNSLSEKELCKLLGLDSGTLTPVLKKLDADGLVRRSRSETDERVVIISLTENGSELSSKISEGPEIVLTEDQVKTLEGLLSGVQ